MSDVKCQQRGCKNDAEYALHLDGDPNVFEDTDEGLQMGERLVEEREFYCAEHAQAALEAKEDPSSIIVSGV